MRKYWPLVAGAVALVLVFVAGWFLTRPDGGDGGGTPGGGDGAPEARTLTVIGGSEKSELLADPEVQRILKDSYGLTLTFTPQGSYSQVQIPSDQLKSRKVDVLWPSSASAQAVFEANGKKDFSDYQAASVLQSPEVVYAGPNATNALIKAGIVKKVGEQYYIVDLKRLVLENTLKGKQWEDLGATGISGPIKIGSTDPATSNSGFTMAQLELTVIGSDNVYQAPSEEQARKALPTVRKLYDAQGLQASSSDAGFKEWLIQGGELRNPLYAGYENQLVQFWVQNKANANLTKQIKDNVRILYPQPTIYNEHPVLALTADGKRLIQAMQDPKIQDIAWKKYGFRSGVTVGGNDVADFKDLALGQNLRVTSAPNAAVTMLLLGCLKDAAKCS